MWIECVQRYLRADRYGTADLQQSLEDYLADMKMRIAKRIDLSEVSGQPREQLSQLIDLEMGWHRGQALGEEKVFAACDQLRREVLA
jgi:hypothetical protein